MTTFGPREGSSQETTLERSWRAIPDTEVDRREQRRQSAAGAQEPLGGAEDESAGPHDVCNVLIAAAAAVLEDGIEHIHDRAGGAVGHWLRQ